MPRRKKHSREYLELGRRIAAARRGRGWTQADLSFAAGINAGYLAEVERGGRNPSLETILNVAAALNTGVGSLVDGLPPGLSPDLVMLAEIWSSLGEPGRKILLQLASLLAGEPLGPDRRSVSKGKSRAKTSQ